MIALMDNTLIFIVINVNYAVLNARHAIHIIQMNACLAIQTQKIIHSWMALLAPVRVERDHLEIQRLQNVKNVYHHAKLVMVMQQAA